MESWDRPDGDVRYVVWVGLRQIADLSAEHRWTAAFSRAKQRGSNPLVSESALFFRVPITNDVATYFI